MNGAIFACHRIFMPVWRCGDAPSPERAWAATPPAQKTTVSSMVPRHCTMLADMRRTIASSMRFFASILPTVATTSYSALSSVSCLTAFSYAAESSAISLTVFPVSAACVS